MSVPNAMSQKYPINDRREIFGWIVYDWANSAFVTTVATVLFGPYLTAIAQGVVGENGVVLDLGPLGAITAKSLYPFSVSASVLLQVFMLPVLGALADYSHLKKRLMMAMTAIGVTATSLIFLVTAGWHLAGALLFIVANLAIGGAGVLYNAYLNDITTEDQRDRVSSRGFAFGYLGGGILLALNLVLVLAGSRFGVSPGLAVRLSILSAGLWWAGFSVLSFSRLRSRGAARPLPPGKGYLTVGFQELVATLRELGSRRQTLAYLISYLLYNDGIQTVISISSVFLAQELFVARGLPADNTFLIGLILMVQFVAFFGSLLFELVARVTGTKRAIMASLALWLGVVLYAYGFLQTVTEAWFMGAVIAIALGSSQALSRALFSRMIPAGREASFFAMYEVSQRGTSWIGPAIFAFVVGSTGSYRAAILSLIVLFAAGMVGLALTNVRRGEAEARA